MKAQSFLAITALAYAAQPLLVDIFEEELKLQLSPTCTREDINDVSRDTLDT